MLILQYFEYKNFIQEEELTSFACTKDIRSFSEGFQNLFWLYGLSETSKFNLAVLTMIRKYSADDYLFVKLLDILSKTNKNHNRSEVAKNSFERARAFLIEFVLKFKPVTTLNEIEVARIARSVTALLKVEAEKGFLPKATYNSLEKAANKLHQKLNDPAIRQLVHCGEYQLTNQIIASLTDEQFSLLQYPFLQQLLHIDYKVFAYKELFQLGSRQEELKTHQHIFASTSLADSIKSAEKTVNRLDLKELFLLIWSRTDWPLLHLPKLLSCSITMANTPSFALFVKLLKEKGSWDETIVKIQYLILAAYQNKYPEPPLDLTIQQFAEQGIVVKCPLEQNEIITIKNDYEIIKKHKELLGTTGVDELKDKLKECMNLLKRDANNREAKCLLLAIIREHFKQSFGLLPYDMQMLNVLALLNDPKSRRLAQIKTGEGKSAIISIMAAFLALVHEEKVDIITTSDDLAERDEKKYKPFYAGLRLTAGHNKKWQDPGNYSPDIIYGTVSNFEFSHILENTSAVKIREHQRPYHIAIVDEVDSMFLDTQDNLAILATNNQCTINQSDMFTQIWQFMTKTQFKSSVSNLGLMLESTFGSNSHFTNKNVNDWHSSALTANSYQENVQYVITDNNEKSIIEIVDYRSTGQICTGSRWDKGLHALLEAKHGLKPEAESLTIGSISHVDYFNKYQRLYGVSGTCGGLSAQRELECLYNVSLYHSPTYRLSLKKELSPILSTSEADFQDKLHTIISASKRPVLLAFESIAETLKAEKYLQGSANSIHIYNAVQNQSAEAVLGLAGNPDTLTIATNTAARGADITCSPESIEMGGLLVIGTFLTENERVEEQLFGRTGRQGAPGEYLYVFTPKASKLLIETNLSQNHPVDLWRLGREKLELQRSVNRMQRRIIHSLRHQAQELFFSLSPETRAKTAQIWAIHYSRIAYEVQHEINHEKETIQRIITLINSEVKKFWLKINSLMNGIELESFVNQLNNPTLRDLFIKKILPNAEKSFTSSHSSSITAAFPVD
ncbi:MAG: hypothetical protein H0U73_09945 [Tatlockia sp.]|nr:hypothetical protein [Tatlockia sp.]